MIYVVFSAIIVRYVETIAGRQVSSGSSFKDKHGGVFANRYGNSTQRITR